MGDRSRVDHRHRDPERKVVLPAVARTVGTSLRGDLVIVAHSGEVHLAVTADRAFVHGLEEALAKVDTTAARCPPDESTDHDSVPLPDEVPFLQARPHEFTVHGRDVHVVLQAVDEAPASDLYVELRLDPPLLRRIEQHRNRRYVTHALKVVLVLVLVLAWTALKAGHLTG
jgi:hypothetical protein